MCVGTAYLDATNAMFLLHVFVPVYDNICTCVGMKVHLFFLCGPPPEKQSTWLQRLLVGAATCLQRNTSDVVLQLLAESSQQWRRKSQVEQKMQTIL